MKKRKKKRDSKRNSVTVTATELRSATSLAQLHRRSLPVSEPRGRPRPVIAGSLTRQLSDIVDYYYALLFGQLQFLYFIAQNYNNRNLRWVTYPINC